MSTHESGERDPGLWQQGAVQRAQFLGPATELMLDLANLQEGSRVLDVAAGAREAYPPPGAAPPRPRREPGMFALGSPGRLTGCFTAAGFRDVAAHTVAATRCYPSPADAVQQLAATQLTVRSLLAQLHDADRVRALHEMELALD